MSTQYLGELRIFSFSFAPKYWALCNGQLLPINSNTALFSLLGTTYGGNGITSFALPNLQGRIPMHVGNGHVLGEQAGEETHAILPSEMPAHTHLPNADIRAGDNTSSNPRGAYLANTAPVLLYSSGSSNLVTMAAAMVSTAGGSQAHENRQPYLTLNVCIALQGIFPTAA